MPQKCTRLRIRDLVQQTTGERIWVLGTRESATKEENQNETFAVLYTMNIRSSENWLF